MGKRPKKAPPLDDPRWVPMKVAIAKFEQKTGSVRLATGDLRAAMASDKLRSMRRHEKTGEYERLTPAFWDDEASKRRVGVAYFVWGPDLDALFGAEVSAREETEGSSDAPTRAKSGPKPHGNWPTLIAQWLIAVAAEDPKRLQNVDALVAEADNFLRNRLKWAPSDPKALRTKIRELLRDLRP